MTVNRHTLLLVAAIVLFVIFGLVGFDIISTKHPDGFLGFGLACFAASFL